MSLPPESIEVGNCYLADQRQYPQIWRVDAILPDGRLDYKARPVDPTARQHWKMRMTSTELFAAAVSREVPCDWMPEREG